MNVKQRILAVRLADKIQRKSQYAEALGISMINRAAEVLSKEQGQEKRAMDRFDVKAKGV